VSYQRDFLAGLANTSSRFSRDDRVWTMAELEAEESPAVVAAVKRALGRTVVSSWPTEDVAAEWR
jgi:hypothetical protein